MYNGNYEVASLVNIYVYVCSKTIFSPVVLYFYINHFNTIQK